MFGRKYWLVRRNAARSVTFAGPSEWVISMSRRSIVGRNFPAYCLENLVDSDIVFHREWRYPHEKFIILFCGFGGRSNPYKGWLDLVSSIHELLIKEPHAAKRIMINVCGEDADDIEIDGVTVHFLGEVTDSLRLCKVYHDADILAFPSREETQGMVKIEGLLCGLPVVAFNRTACAEGVIHGETGWIAPDDHIGEFACGLLHFYRLFISGGLDDLHERIAERSVRMFSKLTLIENIESVYGFSS